MKKYLSLVACAGLLLPAMSFAQLDVVYPTSAYTYTVAPGASAFHDLIIEMTADSSSLYVPEGAVRANVNSTIYWDWDGNVTTGAWSSTSTSIFDIKFDPLVTNPDNFSSVADARINVGYFGNESIDDNELWVKEGNTSYLLFDYDPGEGSPDGPPMSYSIGYTGANPTYTVEFQHRDISVGTTSVQGEELKFKIYQAYQKDRSGNYQAFNTYLFTIGDRIGVNDTDYDDGFFLVQFGDAPIVPEPSAIAALALAGLGGLLVVRRRMLKTRR